MAGAVAAGRGVTPTETGALRTAPPSRPPGGRLDRTIRGLIVLTVAMNVIYLGALLLPGDPASLLIDVWMSITAQWLPVGVFWLVAVRTRFRRWEVILAAAGVTFNAAGDTVYALAMGPDGVLPSPSLADIGYLLYYPLTMAALLVLVRRQSGRSLRTALFDAGVASLGAAAVLAVVLAPVFTDASSATTLLDAAIAGLYPLFDLLLITAVVGVSASPALRLGPRWPFLVLGFLLFAGADVAYALLSHVGGYSAGSPLDVLWTAGLAYAAIWVDGVTERAPVPPRARSHARHLPVPAFAVLAGLGVLLTATQTPVPTVALALAAATVVLAAVSVMLRQATLARLLEAQEDVVWELQKLDASKSTMIDTMSHEMRTPLTSILGYLDLVLDDDTVDVGTKDMLRVVERNAHRLQSLAGTMLLLTRLEAGEAAPLAGPIAVDQMLRRIEESLHPLADSRNVELHVVADEAAVVDGDEGPARARRQQSRRERGEVHALGRFGARWGRARHGLDGETGSQDRRLRYGNRHTRRRPAVPLRPVLPRDERAGPVGAGDRTRSRHRAGDRSRAPGRGLRVLGPWRRIEVPDHTSGAPTGAGVTDGAIRGCRRFVLDVRFTPSGGTTRTSRPLRPPRR